MGKALGEIAEERPEDFDFALDSLIQKAEKQIEQADILLREYLILTIVTTVA
ncbi:hypothetical protein SAMN04488692_12425 [Halarsenatibacter silvermanii]|uniref:Uncharacterized protein n=1 Tax=Halarsenatibacter silvermanii TaxID=321763 RepID=A0A1G9RXX8_9FIRM|nr:hypothetical protein SAMN04488692_12425 [Halarsenatibacter silvermanii]